VEPVPNSVSPLMKVVLKAGEFVKWVHVENDKNFAKNLFFQFRFVFQYVYKTSQQCSCFYYFLCANEAELGSCGDVLKH